MLPGDRLLLTGLVARADGSFLPAPPDGGPRLGRASPGGRARRQPARRLAARHLCLSRPGLKRGASWSPGPSRARPRPRRGWRRSAGRRLSRRCCRSPRARRACRRRTPLQAVLAASGNALPCVPVSHRHLPLLAVGDATAARARTAGFARVESADGDATDLARLVERLCDPARPPLAGPRRRAARPAAGRAAAGGPGSPCCVASPTPRPPRRRSPRQHGRRLHGGTLAAAMFFSGKAARAFVALAQDAARRRARHARAGYRTHRRRGIRGAALAVRPGRAPTHSGGDARAPPMTEETAPHMSSRTADHRPRAARADPARRRRPAPPVAAATLAGDGAGGAGTARRLRPRRRRRVAAPEPGTHGHGRPRRAARRDRAARGRPGQPAGSVAAGYAAARAAHRGAGAARAAGARRREAAGGPHRRAGAAPTASGRPTWRRSTRGSRRWSTGRRPTSARSRPACPRSRGTSRI